MVSRFYSRYSRHLLWLVVLSFPYLVVTSQTIPCNNDIETWLPRESSIRTTYDEFRSRFGGEELIFVGLPRAGNDDQFVEALCSRIDALPGVRKSWSPERMRSVMRDLKVQETEIERRLDGVAVSRDQQLLGLAVLLSDEGLRDRAATVIRIREEFKYCQIADDHVHLAGAPIVIAELDRLGGVESNQLFFGVTLLTCFALLYYSLRDWKLALSLVGLTVWAITLTLSVLHLAGGEKNFIMDALPVMVMVFTLATSVHFLNYYAESMDHPNPLARALSMGWKPCFLATLTTSIGLVSLTVSDIMPVSQFGYAAALGSFVAFFTGICLTPAILTIRPPMPLPMDRGRAMMGGWSNYVLQNCRPVAIGTLALVMLACVGLFHLNSKIDPLDFLPNDSKVLSDIKRIQSNFSTTDSIEATVDFRGKNLTFYEKLSQVRRLESVIEQHPAIDRTMSVTDFFPLKRPESPLEAAALLKSAQSHQGENEYLADGDNLWRISARLKPSIDGSFQQALYDLELATTGSPITFTGIAPLLEQAQADIYAGFKESFGMAFAIISLVMIVSLRSLKAGLIAMIPNLTPICIVFGTMGWFGYPLDIGIMMTGSIALGIAVDGTFHYLLSYQETLRETNNSQRAARVALWRTGPPIFQAAVISAIGMLALTLSSFGPTARFGYTMAAMLLAALVGDLVLLPALLYLRPGRQKPKSHTTSRLRENSIHRPAVANPTARVAFKAIAE